VAKKYAKRAEAIAALLKTLKTELEKSSSYSDRAAIIVASVEIVNTLLYTFDFSPKVYKNIGEILNEDFVAINDESDINRVTPKVDSVLGSLIIEAEELLQEQRGNP